MTNLDSSRHFTLQHLAEHVVAAVAADGGAAICNAGLIDLGGLLVVFDAFLSPQAGADLRRFAEQHFGQPPQLVIASHFHNDHTWGCQAFLPEAQVLSSAQTRHLISTYGKEELEWFSASSAQKLVELQAQHQHAGTERERKDIELFMGEYAGVVEALPTLKVCLPSVTFSHALELHGKALSARLVEFTGGHSGSDVVLHLPEPGIVFMSDLLFVQAHPYLADGDLHSLLEALREIHSWQASTFVPGHGPVGTVRDVEALIDYVEHCLEVARLLVEKGDISEENINALSIPPAFQSWRLAQFYRVNLNFACQQVSARLSPAPSA